MPPAPKSLLTREAIAGAQCVHRWEGARSHQVCAGCGALCTRGKDGKLETYERDPKLSG